MSIETVRVRQRLSVVIRDLLLWRAVRNLRFGSEEYWLSADDRGWTRILGRSALLSH
jgi:hypothetical protein